MTHQRSPLMFFCLATWKNSRWRRMSMDGCHGITSLINLSQISCAVVISDISITTPTQSSLPWEPTHRSTGDSSCSKRTPSLVSARSGLKMNIPGLFKRMAELLLRRPLLGQLAWVLRCMSTGQLLIRSKKSILATNTTWMRMHSS